MARWCFHSGDNFSDSVLVPVPADVLWETVADLDALPEVVTMVTGFERVSGMLQVVQDSVQV